MFSAKERKIWSKLNFPKIKKIKNKNKKASFLWHTQIFLYPNNCTVHEKYLTEIVWIRPQIKKGLLKKPQKAGKERIIICTIL